MRRLLFVLMLLSTLVPSSIAADGIAPGEAFKVPFLVEGKPAINRAEFSVVDGKAVLTVHYLKGDSIAVMRYSVSRHGDPDPKPVPIKNPIAVVVEESKNRTPEQAVVMASPKVRALLGEGRFRIVDPVNDAGKVVLPADSTKPFVQEAMVLRNQWPILIIADDSGRILFKGKLPETTDAMLKLVGQYKEPSHVGSVISGTSH